jgi:DNA-binding response OmpR family regulator
MTKPALRLLLIEDHADLAEATAGFLQHKGFEVQIAQTGKEAVRMALEFLSSCICRLVVPFSGVHGAGWAIELLRVHAEKLNANSQEDWDGQSDRTSSSGSVN